MSILQETDDLLALYLHAIGTSRIPMAIHKWVGLSGIAACLEDRVWVEKLNKELNPSLWVFILAPSGCGKGTAMDELMGYIKETPINLFYGEVTAQALKKRMSGKPKEGTRSKAKQYLVNEEAAACIRSGGLAHDFITHMTANYKVPRGIAYRASTITSGDMATYDQCINWLLGSTMEWAISSIPPDAIQGGFLGRLLPLVIDDYDPRNKTKGVRPPDLEDVQQVLIQKFQALCEMEGQFRVSKQARELHDRWDLTRELPTEERLRATYVRMDDNVWKLAIVFAASEFPEARGSEMIILERHMANAIKAAEGLMIGAKKLLDASCVTERTKDFELCHKILRNHNGVMRHSVLMRRLASYGIDKIGMMKGLEMMKGMGKLKEHIIPSVGSRTAKGYSFKGKW